MFLSREIDIKLCQNSTKTDIIIDNIITYSRIVRITSK